MALKDDVFNMHIKKQTKKQYSHFRPFDDPNKNKLDTKATQLAYERDTIDKQKEHNRDTDVPLHKNEESTKHTQKNNLYVTQPDTNVIHQHENNFSIFQLCGIQKRIVLLIYECCKIHRNSVTPPISFEYLCNSINAANGSIKTSVQRLFKKGFLQRAGYKNGRAGWVQFRLPEKIYQELLNLDTSRSIFMENKPDTQSYTTSTVVSSSYINTTTNIPNEFKSIDCMPLSEAQFTTSHIIQIYREYEKKPHLALSPNIIQDSINALAFDLKHNKVADDFKSSPAVVLTAILKKGIPYASKTPEKFKTPQQEAMDAYLAAKEQQKLAAIETEEKIKQLEFTEWQSSLSEEELLELCPENEISDGVPEKLRKTARRKKALESSRDYFYAEIWPLKKQSILT